MKGRASSVMRDGCSSVWASLPKVAETDGGIAMGLLASGDLQAATDLAADAVSRAIALDAGYLLPGCFASRALLQSDLGMLEDAESTLLLALEVANSHSRVERGFILAELGQLARRDRRG